MEAERDTIDRYVAAYLSERVGELVDCRITGVQPFGFFATVEGLGGDGLVPVSTLGTEYFRYDEASQTLVGEDSGERFAPGQRLKLRLVEANPVWAALRFELPDAGLPRPGRAAAPAATGGAARDGVPPPRAAAAGPPTSATATAEYRDRTGLRPAAISLSPAAFSTNGRHASADDPRAYRPAAGRRVGFVAGMKTRGEIG